MNREIEKQIVTRVFIETGKDGPKFIQGAIEYIDKLEKVVLRLDKAVRELENHPYRKRARRRNDIYDILREFK